MEKKARANWRHHYTREQQQVRTDRDILRRYCSCSTTARHHYAHWLNELLGERLATTPRPDSRGPTRSASSWPGYSSATRRPRTAAACVPPPPLTPPP